MIHVISMQVAEESAVNLAENNSRVWMTELGAWSASCLGPKSRISALIMFSIGGLTFT